jgi:hypothetical protein
MKTCHFFMMFREANSPLSSKFVAPPASPRADTTRGRPSRELCYAVKDTRRRIEEVLQIPRGRPRGPPAAARAGFV